MCYHQKGYYIFDIRYIFRTRKSWTIIKRFYQVVTWSKSWNFQNPFMGREIAPLDIFHSNISIRSTFIEYILLLKPHPFWDQGHIMKHFGSFCTWIYISSTEYLGSKKVAKKDENNMSCTRLYVEPTEILIGKARKRILLIIP